MEYLVSAQPNLFLEAVELLYAYVNNDPPEKLTTTGVYCLPEEAVHTIYNIVCAEVSSDDPEMRYYFERCVLSEDPRRDTCIARNLAYTLPHMYTGSVAGDCQRIRKMWYESICDHNSLVSVGEYCLYFITETEGPVVPVVEGINDLAVSPAYISKLQEQFQDYDRAISRLEALVTPTAAKLEPFLAPWAQKAEPLAQVWRESLQRPETADSLLKRICFEPTIEIRSQFIQLRYLHPDVSPGSVYLCDGSIYAHMGVDLPIEKRCSKIEHWELEAFRLLGSDSRLKILRILLDQPMSTRELAQKLQMNLGTVARDIRSMYDSRLLLVEASNNRVFYRTNMQTMRLLGTHISRLDEFYQI